MPQAKKAANLRRGCQLLRGPVRLRGGGLRRFAACAFQEVDGVDADGLFGLPNLPRIPSMVAFESLDEQAYLVRERVRCRGPADEQADPPDEVGRRPGIGDVRFEQEVREALQ